MATSSIFATFNINDKKTAEAFVNAVDSSSKDIAKSYPTHSKAFVIDKKRIADFFNKGKQNG